MFATIRRYEGVDQNRAKELSLKVNESLLPKLTTLPGFGGYYLIDTGDGVFSSMSIFETTEQADESTSLVTTWLRDEKLDTAVPNAPRITRGAVTASHTSVIVHQNGDKVLTVA